MKKIICLCLALVMVFGLVACGNSKTDETTPVDTTPIKDVTTPTTPNENEEADTEGASTAADTLKGVFMSEATKSNATLASIANALSAHESIPFMPMVQAMEPGYLPGFDAEITNFAECYTICPAIGSIPFVSYVFTLEDGADVDAFVKTLEDNHNLRWNICVAAEQMLTAVEGNYVYFVMSPNAFETEGAETETEVEPETNAETVDTTEATTDGTTEVATEATTAN